VLLSTLRSRWPRFQALAGRCGLTTRQKWDYVVTMRCSYVEHFFPLFFLNSGTVHKRYQQGVVF